MKLAPVILAASILAAGLVIAGPLTPPAGPPAPTFKTLSEVEPRIPVGPATTPGDVSCVYKITQPGSYYLTGNVTGVAGEIVIRIASGGVTLDLAGFSIFGGTSGIDTLGSADSPVIRNGAVSGCLSTGVYLAGSSGALLEDLRVSQCGWNGISVGQRSTALRCDCAQVSVGFSAGSLCRFDSCNAATCTTAAFYAQGQGTSFLHCTASQSPVGFQISGSAGTIVEACTAQQNNGPGFVCGIDNHLTGCTAVSNDTCGFQLGARCTAERCTANQNTQVGLVVNSDGTVRECTACGNGQQGIETVGPDCLIVANQVRVNGAGLAGIWIHSGGCRVEGNDSSGQGFGLYVDGTGNFVARNTCRGNSNQNFSVAPGNDVAPIVTSPGANSFTTMTPWSNVAY